MLKTWSRLLLAMEASLKMASSVCHKCYGVRWRWTLDSALVSVHSFPVQTIELELWETGDEGRVDEVQSLLLHSSVAG